MLCRVPLIGEGHDLLLSQLASIADFEIGGVTEFPHDGICGVRGDAGLAQRDISGGLVASYSGDASGLVRRAADVALKPGSKIVVCDETPLNRSHGSIFQMAAVAHDYAATPSRCLSL